MKKKRIMAILGLIFAIGMLLSGISLFTNPPVDNVDIDPTTTGYVYVAIGVILTIICIIVLIKNKKEKKHHHSYEEHNYGNTNNNFSQNRSNNYSNGYHNQSSRNNLVRKPVPYKLWAVITLILVYGSSIGICFLVKDPGSLFTTIGGFVSKYIIVFAIIFIVFAFYSSKQLFYYSTADNIISFKYHVATNYKVSMISTMIYGFKNFFPGVFGNGPLVYTNQENEVAKKRVIHYVISMIMKFVFPYIAMLGLTGYTFEWFTSGGQSIIKFTPEDLSAGLSLLLLILGPSLDILFYIFIKILPTRKVDEYEITTYYRDGTVTKEKELRTNIIAVLFMGALTFLYTCGFFWYFCPRQLGRIKETLNFVKFGNEQYSQVTIFEYYQGN